MVGTLAAGLGQRPGGPAGGAAHRRPGRARRRAALRRPATAGSGSSSSPWPGPPWCRMHPVYMALVQESFPESRGLANALYLSMVFVISSVAAVAVGALGDAAGLRWAFVISALVTFLSVPLILLLPAGGLTEAGADGVSREAAAPPAACLTPVTVSRRLRRAVRAERHEDATLSGLRLPSACGDTRRLDTDEVSPSWQRLARDPVRSGRWRRCWPRSPALRPRRPRHLRSRRCRRPIQPLRLQLTTVGGGQENDLPSRR